MSMLKLLRWTLLSLTLTMVLGYTWLMEESLASGVRVSSQIRLNRWADAWIESQRAMAPASGSSRAQVEQALLPLADGTPRRSPEQASLPFADRTPRRSSKQASLPSADGTPRRTSGQGLMPSADGTPRRYPERTTLPLVLEQALPAKLVDGQLTVVEIDEVGYLNAGYLVHLYRISPAGEALHFVQRLVLSEKEQARMQEFDARNDRRILVPGAIFVLISACIVYLFGRRVATSTSRLLRWSEELRIESLPDTAIELPFEELQRIAVGTLASLQRERDAIEDRHRFLRFASHELRTPLAVACANTELLARHGVAKNAEPALERLESSVQDMRQLTDALLWLGRGEAPLPKPEPVDLAALVNKVMQEHQGLAQAKQLNLEHQCACNSPVLAPRVLLSILLSNLISNAVRYTKEGQVEIRSTPQRVVVENRGTEIGGPEQGPGLGLALVAWVVERADWRWETQEGPDFRRDTVSF